MIVGPDNFVINRLPAVFLVVVFAIIVYHSWAACTFRKQYQALKTRQGDGSPTDGASVWLSTGDLVSHCRAYVCMNATTGAHYTCCNQTCTSAGAWKYTASGRVSHNVTQRPADAQFFVASMGGATLSRAGDSVVMGDLPDGDGAWGYGVAVMGQAMVDARECVRASRQLPRREVFLRMSVDSRDGDVFVGLVSEEYVRRTQIVDTPHAEPCLCGYERDHTWTMPSSTRRGCSRSGKQCMACAGCGCCGCSSGVSHQQAQALFGDCTRGGDAALLAGWFAASPGGWGCVSVVAVTVVQRAE